MKKFTTRLFCADAMLAAMCAVLGYLSLDLGTLKITFESLPVLLAAFLFGPVHGFIVGGVGTLIYQLLRYGVSVTTLLWMLPYMLAGLLVGLYAQMKKYNLSRVQIAVAVVLAEALVTLLNTGVMYIDSVIYGYYSYAYIFGSLPVRLVVFAVRSAAFAVAMPPLLKAAGRIYKRG